MRSIRRRVLCNAIIEGTLFISATTFMTINHTHGVDMHGMQQQHAHICEANLCSAASCELPPPPSSSSSSSSLLM
jgi:hypothetical protein